MESEEEPDGVWRKGRSGRSNLEGTDMVCQDYVAFCQWLIGPTFHFTLSHILTSPERFFLNVFKRKKNGRGDVFNKNYSI